MSHEIFLKHFIGYIFSVQHMVTILNCMVFCIVYLAIVHIANWCTWLAHTLCKGLIWNYKNCWAQPWLSFGILQALRWSWECISFFFDWYRILFRNFEICTFSLFSFGWWYNLMENKHQISLYLGLKNGQHCFLDLHLHKGLGKQSKCWWF